LEYLIKQYPLESGALEIQYIEEFFGEFPRKKTASEIVRRLRGRAHLILLANAPLPDDPGSPVSPVGPHFKKIQLSPNPELVQVVDLYYELPESKRQAFIAVMSATISALRNA